MAAWWASLSMTVAKCPLYQRSEYSDVPLLRIWLVARGTGKMPLRNAPKRSSVENWLLCYILEFATTENHSKREISVVGRSGCRPSINVKKVGEGMNVVNNSGFSQNAIQPWCCKSRQGEDNAIPVFCVFCTVTKTFGRSIISGCDGPPERL